MVDGWSRFCLEVSSLGDRIVTHNVSTNDDVACSRTCEGTERSDSVIVLIAEDELACTVGIGTDDGRLSEVEIKLINGGVLVFRNSRNRVNSGGSVVGIKHALQPDALRATCSVRLLNSCEAASKNDGPVVHPVGALKVLNEHILIDSRVNLISCIDSTTHVQIVALVGIVEENRSEVA